MRLPSVFAAVLLLAGAAASGHGNLNQVMRGIRFPNSNIVFDTQGQNIVNGTPAGPAVRRTT